MVRRAAAMRQEREKKEPGLKHGILHIIYSLYHGGAERLIGTLAAASDAERFEHSICALGGGGDLVGEFREEGISVKLLGKKPGFDRTILGRLRKAIDEVSPSILHLHTPSAGFWGTLAAALRKDDIPLVRTEHRPWIPADLPLLHRKTYLMQAKRAFRIIAVSDHTRDSFLRRFPSLSGRLVTVRNGIFADSFARPAAKADCRRWFGLPEDSTIIGTIGRLVPIKNHSLLLGAFASAAGSNPGMHLAILGEGELEDSLRAIAAEKGIDRNVSILPPSPEVSRFLGSLDIFVLTSDSEGLPVTLLEAFAASLPAIAPSVGGIPEVIEDGVDGFLFPKGGKDEFTELLLRLVRSPGLRESMGTRGHDKVIRSFTARRCAAETEKLYSLALGIGESSGQRNDV